MCGSKYVHCVYEALLVAYFIKNSEQHMRNVFSLTSIINCGPPTGVFEYY